jgi:hypothetical protein
MPSWGVKPDACEDLRDSRGLPESRTLEVYAEDSAKNADFKKVWESLLAFRNDQYLWWRVAEYTYDDFLIRNRTRR